MNQTPFSVPHFVPTYADVVDAAHRLHGMAHRTPVLRSTTADERLGAQLFFKCENLQRTGHRPRPTSLPLTARRQPGGAPIHPHGATHAPPEAPTMHQNL